MPENAENARVGFRSIFQFFSDEAWEGRLPYYNDKGDPISPRDRHITSAEAIVNAGYALVKVGEVPPWMELVVDQWGRTDDEGNPAPATYVKPPVYRLTTAPTGRNDG